MIGSGSFASLHAVRPSLVHPLLQLPPAAAQALPSSRPGSQAESRTAESFGSTAASPSAFMQTSSSSFSLPRLGALAAVAPLSAAESAGATTPSRNVAQLLEKLTDVDSKVRAEAVKALGQVARRGEVAVAAAMIGRLADTNRLVRKHALEALTQVADRGDPEVVAGLVRSLRHEAWFVRQAAATAAGRMSHKGDEGVIEMLIARLGDDREEVAQAALDALAAVSRPGDQDVIGAVLEQLGASGSTVRCSAIQTLAQVSDRGDSRVLTELLLVLGDDHQEVRQALISAVPCIAIAGDPTVVHELISKLEAPELDANARAAAASLLGRVSNDDGSSRAPIQSLLKCLQGDEECWLVRRASIDALACIVPRGDHKVVESLVACTMDADSGVRQSAVSALGAVARRGDLRATATLVRLLHPQGSGGDGLHEKMPFMRLAIVQALGQVSPVGHNGALQALLGRLDDPHAGVRDAAAESLKHVSEQGDDALVEALLHDLLAD